MPRKPMLRVGLTGNVASGKTTVADVWRGAGAVVIDADRLAREAVAPGSAALDAIRRRFGAEVFDEAGELDRAALRRTIFADPTARADLEGIVHPEVGRLRAEAEAQAVEQGAALVVHEIPLLYETGLDLEMDLVVLVHATEEARLNRLIDGRGLTDAEARAMMDAQMSAAAKLERADIVLHNDDGVVDLERAARGLLGELRGRAEASV